MLAAQQGLLLLRPGLAHRPWCGRSCRTRPPPSPCSASTNWTSYSTGSAAAIASSSLILRLRCGRHLAQRPRRAAVVGLGQDRLIADGPAVVRVGEKQRKQVHARLAVLALPTSCRRRSCAGSSRSARRSSRVGVDEANSVQGLTGAGRHPTPGEAAVARHQDLAAVSDDDGVLLVDGLDVVEAIGDIDEARDQRNVLRPRGDIRCPRRPAPTRAVVACNAKPACSLPRRADPTATGARVYRVCASAVKGRRALFLCGRMPGTTSPGRPFRQSAAGRPSRRPPRARACRVRIR